LWILTFIFQKIFSAGENRGFFAPVPRKPNFDVFGSFHKNAEMGISTMLLQNQNILRIRDSAVIYVYARIAQTMIFEFFYFNEISY
jgi:hypothetical protein